MIVERFAKFLAGVQSGKQRVQIHCNINSRCSYLHDLEGRAGL